MGDALARQPHRQFHPQRREAICSVVWSRRTMKRVVLSVLFAALPLAFAYAAEPAPVREPYGIGLEGFAYPYPVSMLPLVNDGEQVRMAYMDVAAATPNGRVVLLLHGRNF